MKFIVMGANGLAGSSFIRNLKNSDNDLVELTRENYNSLKGTSCDVFINANGNSKKYLASQDPVGEVDRSVKSVMQSCLDFKFKKYVLISSADVYDCQDNPLKNDEDATIIPEQLSIYGLCKFFAEQALQCMCKDWIILRCGGLIGEGLKKNPVFDILTGKCLYVGKESQLGFISTDEVVEITLMFIKENLSREIINVAGSELVSIEEIIKYTGYKVKFTADDLPEIHYEINNLKLSRYHPPSNSEETVKRFIDKWKDFYVALC